MQIQLQGRLRCHTEDLGEQCNGEGFVNRCHFEGLLHFAKHSNSAAFDSTCGDSDRDSDSFLEAAGVMFTHRLPGWTCRSRLAIGEDLAWVQKE